jgi:hypothetical protein
VRTLLKPVWALGVLALDAFPVTQKGNAIPALPRPYATSYVTFPIDFSKLNDLGKEFLGEIRLFEDSVSAGNIPNFRRSDLNHGDYALGQGKSGGRPDQRPRVGHQQYVLSATSRDAQPVHIQGSSLD